MRPSDGEITTLFSEHSAADQNPRRYFARSLAVSVGVHMVIFLYLTSYQETNAFRMSGSDVVQSVDVQAPRASFAATTMRVEPAMEQPMIPTTTLELDALQVSKLPHAAAPEPRTAEILSKSDLPRWEPLGGRQEQEDNDIAGRVTAPDRPVVFEKSESIRNVLTSTVAIAIPASAGLVDSAPDFSNNPPPSYPLIAIEQGWEGLVVLRLTVDATGRVESVELESSSGYELLDAAAREAVRQWKGQPGTRGGRAVRSEELLPIRFRL